MYMFFFLKKKSNSTKDVAIFLIVDQFSTSPNPGDQDGGHVMKRLLP